MISDFVTNKIYFSKRIIQDKRFKSTFNQIASVLQFFGLKPDLLPKTNDIWARDYMPIQISENKFIEYRYDPDYLQGDSYAKDTRELKTYPDIVCDSIDLQTIKTDIILDGGNVVKSENSIILTDKVVWENRRHYSRKKLLKTLHEIFEVDKVVIIPSDDECEYGHADGMLRFINAEKVLLSGFYDTVDAEFKKMIIKSLEKAKLEWEWLRVSEKEVEENIAYINFLQTQDVIIVPALNKPEDNEAIKLISIHYPDYSSRGRIKNVDMKDIVRYSGALNCITWTTKENVV